MTPGTLVDGKYRVERQLGEGGMATVFAATHIHLNEQVAIKVLLPRFTTEPTVVERFLREARAAVRLKSEHVVRVIDVGTLPTNQPYIAMEFLNGRDLEDLLAKRGGPFPAHEVVDYVLQLCEALAEAHAQGIVHRDIKPANCVLTESRDGMPLLKVLDFGIAKLSLSDGGPRLTGTSTMMGTPAFMSPEQLRGAKDVDLRGDIWAVGIMLYELTMGKVPFEGPTFAKLLMAVQRDPTPPMPTLPPGLAAVIQRCLVKDREQRYQTVADLARELEPFAGNRAHAALLVQRCAGVTRRAATPPAGVPSQTGTPPSGVPSHAGTPPRGVPSHMQSAPGTQPQNYMQTGPQLPQQPPMQSSPSMQQQPHMQSSPSMQQQPHMQSAPGTQPQNYMQTGPQLPQQPHMPSSPGTQQQLHMQSSPSMQQQPHMQSSPKMSTPASSGSRRLLVFVIIGVLAGAIAGVALLLA